MSELITRRSVLAGAGAGAALATLPISMVTLAFGGTREDFTFTYISDAHIQQIKGASFVRNWDQGLKRAVAEANLVKPESDFVMFGGDLAQLGKREE
ncbi:MAG TPA: metallophosphoesterase, partial [Methylosinus sp.]